MDTMFAACAGLDVHKRTVVACRVVGSSRQTRTFGTTTPGAPGSHPGAAFPTGGGPPVIPEHGYATDDVHSPGGGAGY